MQNYHLHNRPNREIKNPDKLEEILNNGKFAVIALCRDNEPYIVTLSYGYDHKKNALYFHCSPVGLKLDFITTNNNVCATIIEDGGYILDECAHPFRSVVIRGKMHIVADKDEQKSGMHTLLNHLEEKPTVIQEKMLKSDTYYAGKMTILRLDIHSIQGKAGR